MLINAQWLSSSARVRLSSSGVIRLSALAWPITALSLLAVGCVGNSDSARSSSTALPTVVTTFVSLPNGLQERTVSYDPPKWIEPNEWLTSESFFSGFPGAPSLVLRMPCVRTSLPPQAEPLPKIAPRITVVQGCTAPKITQGTWAGLFVSRDGEVFTPPPH